MFSEIFLMAIVLCFFLQVQLSCWCIGDLLRYLRGHCLEILPSSKIISLMWNGDTLRYLGGHCYILPATMMISLMYWQSVEKYIGGHCIKILSATAGFSLRTRKPREECTAECSVDSVSEGDMMKSDYITNVYEILSICFLSL